MRFGSPLSLLLATLAGQGLLAGVFAVPPADNVEAGAAAADAAAPINPALPKSPDATDAAAALPEVLELTVGNFGEKTAKGYWFVKHYSPSCSHCKKAAPIWKKFVNYYTTTPVSAESPNGPSFVETYNFNFGSVNCVAYGDLCGSITQYPTFSIYKDGKELEKFDGSYNESEKMSEFVSKYIDKIKADKARSELVAPKSPAIGPNPKGESIPLDAEAFTKRVTLTRDAWLVKFYAPWCTHCQAMAPAWVGLGKEMTGELNVGEVNCEVEKRLCKDIKLRGYPTILFFQNGERVEYDGLRGLGDLVSFARKAANSGIKEVDDIKFKEMEKSGELEVAFVYFYDHAATSEDFVALDRLTLNLVGRAPLLKTKDDDMAARFRVYSRPKFMVVRDGKPSYYNGITPSDMRDYNRVLDWMSSVWLPIVPELTAANSHEIMNGRVVVLGILSRGNADEFVAAKKELKEAATEFMQQRAEEEQMERKRQRDKKQLRLEEAEDRGDTRAIRAAKVTKINVQSKNDVGFAWVDGVFWERWVRTTYGVNVNEGGAKIIINDEDKKQYWDTTVEGGHINPSRSRILETLRDVLSKAPNIRSKSTSTRMERVFFIAKAGANTHPWATTMFFVVTLLVLAVYGRGRMRRKAMMAGGFFKLDGKEGGILGGGSGGKVD